MRQEKRKTIEKEREEKMEKDKKGGREKRRGEMHLLCHKDMPSYGPVAVSEELTEECQNHPK